MNILSYLSHANRKRNPVVSPLSSMTTGSRLWLSSRGYLDACQEQGQRAARLSGPRAEWTGVYARLPAGGLASGPKHTTTHTGAMHTAAHGTEAVRQSRERDVRYTVTGLYQHLDRVSSCLETSNVKRGKIIVNEVTVYWNCNW